MKKLIFVTALLISTICFAITPNSVTSINIENTRGLVSRADKIECTTNCQVNYAVSVQYPTNSAFITPIYLQLAADNVPNANFYYNFSLKNTSTNKYVISNISTRTIKFGSRYMTSLKAKVNIDPSALYLLEVRTTGSKTFKNIIPPFTHYTPILKVYVGAYGPKYQTDMTFSE